MAVLAVFLLLALVGARACEEQQDVSGAPSPAPSPATPTSTPSAAAAITTTEPPPRPPPEEIPPMEDIYDVPPLVPQIDDLPPLPPRRMSESDRNTERSWYKYALLNSAMRQGGGIIHGQRLDHCQCAAKLIDDATDYKDFGAKHWCIDYFIRDAADLGSGDDYDDDDGDDDNDEADDDDDEKYWLTSEEIKARASSQVNRKSYEALICEEEMPEIFPDGTYVCQGIDCPTGRSEMEIDATRSQVVALTSDVELHVVNVHSDNEPVPMDELDIPDQSMEVDDDRNGSDGSSVDVCGLSEEIVAEWSSDSPSGESYKSEELNSVTRIAETYMDVDNGNTESDAQELDEEGSVLNITAEMVIAMARQQKEEEEEEAITQHRKADETVEQASSQLLWHLQQPATTPEPQPGPSGVGRPPSPKTPNISFPDYPGTRYSRNLEPIIYSADGYPGSEMFGPMSRPEWIPPPPADLNRELNRIFGVQKEQRETSPEQLEPTFCLGELRIATLGTNVQPLYTVYVKCHKEPDLCLPPTVCSPVYKSVTVSRRKALSIYEPVFRLMEDPHDEWEPANLELPTACFCAPPDYKQKKKDIFNLPAST